MENYISIDKDSIGVKAKDFISFDTNWITYEDTFRSSSCAYVEVMLKQNKEAAKTSKLCISGWIAK